MPTDHPSLAMSQTARRGRKYFSIEEANRSIPYVSRIVEDITVTYRQAVQTRQRIEHPHREDSIQALKDVYEDDMDRLNDLIDELHQVGVELKDFEKGLIDFPAWFNDREVYLCWRRGEEQVRAWHEVDTGFASRQDIALLRPEAA